VLSETTRPGGISDVASSREDVETLDSPLCRHSPSPPLLCRHPLALLAEPPQRDGRPSADRLSVPAAPRLDSAFGTGLNGSLLVEDIM
jgi:hypothetical protein